MVGIALCANVGEDGIQRLDPGSGSKIPDLMIKAWIGPRKSAAIEWLDL